MRQNTGPNEGVRKLQLEMCLKRKDLYDLLCQNSGFVEGVHILQIDMFSI